jgi:hypothetical protein
MRLFAQLTEKGVSATAALAIPGRGIFGQTVKFIVDTGADITSLSEFEAMKLGIDPRSLPASRKQTITGGGVAETYVLAEAMLIFPGESGAREFHMDFLHILCIPRRKGARTEREDRIRLAFPNLLGRDFLKKYRINLVANFSDNSACMDAP